MDTSEKYIKMCSKSPEIQSTKDSLFDSFCEYNLCGNLFYDTILKEIMVSNCGRLKNDLTFSTLENIFKDIIINDLSILVWIPRQDQLQDMFDGGLEFMLDKILPPIHNQRSSYWGSFGGFKNPEQLFLAFVMKEKYNKFWSETKQDWILNN